MNQLLVSCFHRSNSELTHLVQSSELDLNQRLPMYQIGTLTAELPDGVLQEKNRNRNVPPTAISHVVGNKRIELLKYPISTHLAKLEVMRKKR